MIFPGISTTNNAHFLTKCQRKSFGLKNKPLKFCLMRLLYKVYETNKTLNKQTVENHIDWPVTKIYTIVQYFGILEMCLMTSLIIVSILFCHSTQPYM